MLRLRRLRRPGDSGDENKPRCYSIFVTSRITKMLIFIGVHFFAFISGIVIAAFSPLGSPERPLPNKEAQPVLLNDPVLKKIADKHKTTVALVSGLITNIDL